jgi:hypothetical protein
LTGTRVFRVAPSMRTNCNDGLARSDELFGDETNVESSIKARKEALEYVFEAFEMPTPEGHAFRHVVDDVRSLQSP